MSEEAGSRETMEDVSTTEAAAKAEVISIVPPTLRQQHRRQAPHNKGSNQLYAGGTENSETNLSNVQQIAPDSNPSPLHKARETVKGAVDSELGDLLLPIIIKK